MLQVNSKVSLITNSNIRYEGILVQIKSQDKRLLLKDVKSFGTEGRNNGVNEVATPKADDPNNFYALVEFQIPMIKELYVIEAPPAPVLSDPAIVSVTKTEEKDKTASAADSQNSVKTNESNNSEGTMSKDAAEAKEKITVSDEHDNIYDNHSSEFNKNKRRGKMAGYGQSYNLQEKYKDEFNFANCKLVEDDNPENKKDQDDENEKHNDETGEPDAQQDPNDLEGFFSTMSFEDEAKGDKRFDREEAYNMNAETFGLKPYNSRYRNNNRGGGRGGRSRPRGRYYGGRGGYQQRGGHDNYRSRGGYNKNYSHGYHADDGYKKHYNDYDKKYDKPYKPYEKPPFNKHYEKEFEEAEPELEHKPSQDEDELSFPEYKPPQVHYRGGAKRGSAQGKQPRATRGRFAYFSEEHDT